MIVDLSNEEKCAIADETHSSEEIEEAEQEFRDKHRD